MGVYGASAVLIDQSALDGCCGQYHTNHLHLPEHFPVSIFDWHDLGIITLKSEQGVAFTY